MWGGGAAIVVNLNKFSLEKIEIGIPHNLEVVWGLMRPKKTKSKIREIIVGAFLLPLIAPPVPRDDPRCGVPSDHSTPIATPLTLDSVIQTRENITKTYRHLPDSGIREFGQWICGEGWDGIPDIANPTEQVLAFEKIVNEKMDEILPQKDVKLNQTLTNLT